MAHGVRIWSFIAAVAGVCSASAARAEVTKAECASAYEQAQEFRASGDLRQSREALFVCANAACPSFVQSDCGNWLVEVEQEIPTIVVAAKGPDGHDTIDVRITMDDQVLAERLDGTAIEANPGKHVFRFEHAGAIPIERQMVLRQGEKNRFIELDFAPDDALELLETSPYDGVDPAPGPSPEVDEPFLPAPEPAPGPLRPYAYVAAGVGGLGFVGFAVFGLIGKGEEAGLADGCGKTRTCAQDDVDAAKRKLVIADVSALIGIAGVGTGIALWLMSEPSEPSTHGAGDVAVTVGAAPGGATATLRGVF